jgi:hypothetical protein
MRRDNTVRGADNSQIPTLGYGWSAVLTWDSEMLVSAVAATLRSAEALRQRPAAFALISPDGSQRPCSCNTCGEAEEVEVGLGETSTEHRH